MTRLERLAPLSGIAAVGLLVTEISITGHAPAIDTPAQATIEYWMDNATERLASIAHAGAIFIAAGLCAYASFGLAAVHAAEKSASGDLTSTVQTLNVLNGEDLYMLIAVGSALLLLSTAVSVLRHGGLPRWIGWVSLVFGIVAVVVLVVGVWVSGYGFVAFPLLGLWIPVVAFLIYVGQPAAAIRVD